MNLDNFLNLRTKQLEEQISSELKVWEKETIRINPNLRKLTKAFLESFKGGKKLRGLLVELGYEIASNTFSENFSDKKILKVASAYEIFHSSILIHDDIIDQSEKRRGAPTLYRRLGGSHYGISQALSLGDTGFFLAVKNISESTLAPEYKSKALTFFAEVIIDTCLGELLDVEVPLFKDKYSTKDVITIHTLKTAAYTISGPLILGAILAGANNDLTDKLKQFGLNLGLAFQIQDDLLGVFGEEKVLGKSVSSDIEEGKNTLLISRAFFKSTNRQKLILNELYGKKGLKSKEIEKIKEIFIETKALDYSKLQAERYVKKALSLVSKLTNDKKMQLVLEDLSKYLISRSK